MDFVTALVVVFSWCVSSMGLEHTSPCNGRNLRDSQIWDHNTSEPGDDCPPTLNWFWFIAFVCQVILYLSVLCINVFNVGLVTETVLVLARLSQSEKETLSTRLCCSSHWGRLMECLPGPSGPSLEAFVGASQDFYPGLVDPSGMWGPLVPELVLSVLWILCYLTVRDHVLVSTVFEWQVLGGPGKEVLELLPEGALPLLMCVQVPSSKTHITLNIPASSLLHKHRCLPDRGSGINDQLFCVCW